MTRRASATRELVRGAGAAPIPAFRVEMEFAGLRHDVVGHRHRRGRARREPAGADHRARVAGSARSAMAVSRRMQVDLLQTAGGRAAACGRAIDEPRDVRRMRLRIDGARSVQLPSICTAAGRRVDGDVVELRDPQQLTAGRGRSVGIAAIWRRKPFIESDAPEIRAEAEIAVARRDRRPRSRAERLTRHVNALLDKKPTVSLPSAREVLRTKVGDCNEHTALYVAMARALGIPARIAVGLVYVRGAFYYHAWPEVYIDEAPARGLWLPVDPTFNQFPADATHLRLARGGLDKQAAILPLIGRLKIDDPRPRAGAELDADPRRHGSAPTSAPLAIRRFRAGESACWAAVRRPMIAIDDLVKRYGTFTAVDGVSLDVQPGEIHGFLGPNGAGKTTTLRMIAGLLKPTSGRILVNGHDLAREPEAAKASLGFIPDRPFIYEKLTAGEFLRFHGGLYGLERQRHRRARARDARAVRARTLGERAGRELLARHEAAARDVRRVPASAARGARRRADGRPRSARRAADQGRVPADERARRRDPDEHAHARSRAGDVRSHQHHPEGQDHRAAARWPSCARWRGGRDDQLTSVFLKLTGGSGLQEIDEIV